MICSKHYTSVCSYSYYGDNDEYYLIIFRVSIATVSETFLVLDKILNLPKAHLLPGGVGTAFSIMFDV